MGTFTLDGGNVNSSDSGTDSVKFSTTNARRSPAGQIFEVSQRTEALNGSNGTLVIRSTARLFPDVEGTDNGTGVATGTWSIVSGTGRYAGVKGNGELVGIDAQDHFHYRFEGYATGT